MPYVPKTRVIPKRPNIAKVFLAIGRVICTYDPLAQRVIIVDIMPR